MAPPRRNRVAPTGELIAVPDRGSLMGNRGCLHDERGEIRRAHRGKRWIYCRLSFKGRRRELMRPGRYTELFFLDEATALAAGHRPCAECMRPRFDEFRDAWGGGPSAPELDAVLHAERIGAGGRGVTYRAPFAGLPDGAFVLVPAPHLVVGGELREWRPDGYGEGRPGPVGDVEVLTPRRSVAAIARGFHPDVAGIHPRYGGRTLPPRAGG